MAALSWDARLRAVEAKVREDVEAGKVVAAVDSQSVELLGGLVQHTFVVYTAPAEAVPVPVPVSDSALASVPVPVSVPHPRKQPVVNSAPAARLVGFKDKDKSRRREAPAAPLRALKTPPPLLSEAPSQVPAAAAAAASATATATEAPVAEVLVRRAPPQVDASLASAFSGASCVALVKAHIQEDWTTMSDLTEELERPIPPGSQVFQQCGAPVWSDDGSLEAHGFGAYGFCCKHYELLPVVQESEFEYLFAAVAYVLRVAKHCEVPVWLTKATGVAAFLFQGPCPTGKTATLSLRCGTTDSVVKKIFASAMDHGHRAGYMSGEFGLGAIGLRLRSTDLAMPVQVEVFFEDAPPAEMTELSYGGLVCAVDSACCSTASTELVFDKSARALDVGAVERMQLAVPLGLYKDMQKLTFPVPRGYGPEVPWSMPAPHVLQASPEGFSSVYDPAFQALLSRISSLGRSGRLTPGHSVDVFCSAPRGDNAGFKSQMMELMSITSPGTIRWHYLYSDTPRIVFALRNEAGRAVAYAFVKLFVVKREDGAPKASKKKRRTAADNDAVQQLPQATRAAFSNGCAEGLAAVAAKMMYEGFVAEERLTIAFVDALASAPEARGAGRALIDILTQELLPRFEGPVWAVLEPLNASLYKTYTAMGLTPLGAATQKYCKMDIVRNAELPPIRVALRSVVRFQCCDMYREKLFSNLVEAQDKYHVKMSAIMKTNCRPEDLLQVAMPHIAALVAEHAALMTVVAAEDNLPALVPTESRTEAMLMRQVELVRQSFPALSFSIRPFKHEIVKGSAFLGSLTSLYAQHFYTAVENSRAAATRAARV